MGWRVSTVYGLGTRSARERSQVFILVAKLPQAHSIFKRHRIFQDIPSIIPGICKVYAMHQASASVYAKYMPCTKHQHTAMTNKVHSTLWYTAHHVCLVCSASVDCRWAQLIVRQFGWCWSGVCACILCTAMQGPNAACHYICN